MNNKFDLKRYLIPSDAIYIAIIVIGLFIMIFLNELPVRLIGACLALLSAVVLVMNISQRLKDRVEFRRPTVSQPVELTMKVKKDSAGTRYVFDDFESNFGSDDVSAKGEKQERPRMTFDDTDSSVSEVKVRREPAFKAEVAKVAEELSTDFNDEISGVRIKGKKQVVESNAGDLKKIEISEPVKKEEVTPQPVTALVEDEVESDVVVVSKSSSRKNKNKQSPKLPDNTVVEEFAPETAVLPSNGTVSEDVVELTDELPVNEAVPEPEETSSHKIKQLNIALADLIDDADHPGNEEPRKEFDYLLLRVLQVIRSMMSARTTVFFWVNTEKEELVLESHITDVPEMFLQQRKYPLGMDMISQIANTGRPEILTEIKASAETDLLPYYKDSAQTVSFVGVPVYLNHKVIGVLCADSTVDDAYDEITIGTLGHFTKLISGLIQSYTGKYDLLQSSRTLDALSNFRALVNESNATMSTVANALVLSAEQILDYQSIGVILFDPKREAWCVYAISSKNKNSSVLVNETVEMNNSLISRTIYSGMTTCLEKVDPQVRRYHPNEAKLDNGFFVAIALKSTSHNYGALFVEGHTSQITHKDVSVLETLGEQTGMIIEQMSLHEMMQANQLTDQSSGLINAVAFMNRLEEETTRARDFTTSFLLLIIAIDRYGSIESSLSDFEKEDIFLHVLEIVKRNVKVYDIMGRLDDNLIGVGMSGTSEQEAKLWAERVRKEVAITSKEIKGKRFTVTVSIGLAQARPADNAESLATNAGSAMEIAAAKTNCVVVFN
ncbi:MAG: diguanylate cyclase [Candidatus Kapabacteria bacterium]|nr:diguanylate cyclase [Candidatus Kapabacteria bacterium]MBX7155635.1 diguanylate cyclase [Bacteroidota bacterium]